MSVTLRDKWLLLQRIFADERASQSAKVVAGALLECLNTSTLQCDPSVEKLQGRCGLKRRAVQGALDGLRAAGWVVQRRRRGTSSFSFPALEQVHETAPQEQEEVHDGAPVNREEVRQSAPQLPDEVHETAPQELEEVHETARLQVHKSAPLYRNREIETGKDRGKNLSPAGHQSKRSGLSEAEIEAAFVDWWPRYPKHVDKLGARKVFERQLKAGAVTISELNAGADRYRKQCEARGTEKRFIKGPEVWLNKGCWTDDPDDNSSSKPLNGQPAGRDWLDFNYGSGANPDNSGPIIEAEYERVD